MRILKDKIDMRRTRSDERLHIDVVDPSVNDGFEKVMVLC